MYQDFHEYLSRVQAYATSGPFFSEVIAAKAEFFKATGEIFEEDHFFELRMAFFLDWYVFDRILQARGLTPFQIFLEEKDADFTDEERNIYHELVGNHHSVFEFIRTAAEGVILRDLDSRADYVVRERRGLKAFQKGDLFDARFFPFRGMYFFSGAFIPHPPEVRRHIRRGFKTLSHAAPSERMAFLHRLARMRLKYDRYRHIRPDQIYT